MRKLVVFSLILAFAFMGLLMYRNTLWQEGNPFPVFRAITGLYIGQNAIEQISGSPEKYIVKAKNGTTPFIQLMKNKGWQYQDQMGAGYLFEKDNSLITVNTRMYSKYYVVYIVPDSPQHFETATLVAYGDILMHNTVIASGMNNGSYNYDHLFAPVKKLIKEGDYSSINLESALAGSATEYTGYPLFNSPDSVADALKNAGFDLVVTANNHILDRGLKGALRTLDVLKKSGLSTTGTFSKPEDKKQFLIRNINGIKIGYLAYTYDTNGIPIPKETPYLVNLLEKDKILADITALRPAVDVVVLVLHWGVEYSPYPTEVQQKLAREFFTQGADLIIGSHPHVIQPMETMNIAGKKKFVIYSMGNSVGNQIGAERNSGVIFKFQFIKDFKTGETSLSQVSYTPTFCHPYTDQGRRMFRVVPIEETINAIRQGKEPYLNADSIPLLQQVLADTKQRLGDSLP